MIETALANEPTIRLGIFLGVLASVALWETLSPRRARAVGRWARWPSNLSLVAFDALLVRGVFPMAAVGLALVAEDRGWGLMNHLGLPFWVATLASILLLDLVVYMQHVMFHAVPVLWRLHRMHHADLDFDITTGLRFHPLEILLSMIIKLSAVTVIGAPAAGVLVFEVLLNATAMFNHANVDIPARWDRLLRWFVVTPDMHRIHHSIDMVETDSNYGFNFPWWDKVFRTYRHRPRVPHVAMTVGLEAFRDRRELRLDRLLTQPFRHAEGAPRMLPEAGRE